ncbi:MULTISPECIES: DUF475 domain-containing protein [unclassified Frondihabitans]|uniref:DUF475 domain-containing protein n=1 Tax=unclassified Frondihabitans TaxID=2626248 RepID=UPI0006FADE28|nr:MULTISPECIES: DUF475 domain-containing protein [unclassified Frondihabitans]KQQ27424.1 hypothetical protein ASF54_01035 [Frondihabitans sp. Leaf304]MBF4577428.1 DUF475 domain-containing protein [Frondihabitans sp. VKM Ac-2883]
MFLKTFGWSLVITVLALAIAFLYGGPSALALAAILGVLEISLSFDNAVVNARILERMSPFWQRIFLTVGILIAVLGMRILFPLVIVSVTSGLNPVEAVKLALEKGSIETPGTYAYILHDAHPQIAAFGGIFLLMIFLDFMFEKREIRWIGFLEKPLAKIGQINAASVIVGLAGLVAASLAAGDKQTIVLIAGIAGMILYFLVNGLGDLFDVGDDEVEEENGESELDADSIDKRAAKVGGGNRELGKVVGKAAFLLFLYLEVIDASFSFDGVIGAFAITSDPIIIALGLGLIGAIFVRSLTVFLVRQGTLDEFVYLDHGAHWAIGALSVILLVTITTEVSEVVTGLIGVLFILAAFITSVMRNRRLAEAADHPVESVSV